jgi:hypothetical protein
MPPKIERQITMLGQMAGRAKGDERILLDVMDQDVGNAQEEKNYAYDPPRR